MFSALPIFRLIGIIIGWCICAKHFAIFDHVFAIGNEKPPVIFIHGIMGSKLFIQGTDVQYPDELGPWKWLCPKNFEWKKVWMSLWNLIVLKNCGIHQMKLYYNYSSGRFQNLPGIQISVGDPANEWDDFQSIFCLVSGEGTLPKWWFEEFFFRNKTPSQKVVDTVSCQAMVDYQFMHSDVYVIELFRFLARSLNLLPHDGLYVAPYDWRHNYNSDALNEYYGKLTNMVEDAVKNHSKKVTFIAHSMGNLVLSHFLQLKDEKWLKKHVHAQINMSPPYGGTTLMMSGLKDSYNTMAASPGIKRAGQQFFLHDKYINYFMRSIPSAVTLLPRQHSFGRVELFRDLEEQRNFGADEMVEFLSYLGLPEMVDIYEATNQMKLPPSDLIEIHCIYSTTTLKKTPTVYVYTGSGKTFNNFGDGDERVNLESMQNPCNWFIKKRAKIGKYNVKNYTISGADHMEIVGNTEALEIVEKILLDHMGGRRPRGALIMDIEKGREIETRSNLDELNELNQQQQWEKFGPATAYELHKFFKYLPEIREKKKNAKQDAPDDIWEAKTDPSHVWAFYRHYPQKAWDNIPLFVIDQEENGYRLDKLLDIVRTAGAMDEDYNELILLKKPWELAANWKMEDGQKQAQTENEQWDGVDLGDERYLATVIDGNGNKGRLKADFEGILEDLKKQFGETLELKLIPLGIMINKIWRQNSNNKIKFLILGVQEFREKIGNKSISEIIKKCDHALFEFQDPKLDSNSIEIKRTPSHDISKIGNYVATKMNLTSVKFAISDKKWAIQIGNNEGANFGKVVEEFIELIRTNWSVKVDSRLEGGKAEDFALVREELTDHKLGQKLRAKTFVDGTMKKNRLKWEKKIRFVRFKYSLTNSLDQFTARMEDVVKHFFNAKSIILFPLATMGKDTIFFLMISADAKVDGIFRLDDLAKNAFFSTISDR